MPTGIQDLVTHERPMDEGNATGTRSAAVVDDERVHADTGARVESASQFPSSGGVKRDSANQGGDTRARPGGARGRGGRSSHR